MQRIYLQQDGYPSPPSSFSRCPSCCMALAERDSFAGVLLGEMALISSSLHICQNLAMELQSCQ